MNHSKAINHHRAAALQASHTYLTISIWLREKHLAGFSPCLHVKNNEERSWLSLQSLFKQVCGMAEIQGER